MDNMVGKKRLCFFAGFDAHGEIADYVIYYLKALSQIADVYYWGDFSASDAEKAKLEPYCQAIYCEKHEKYDFGSWQELIQKVGREKISTYDELILANDSCYGPLFDLSETFQKMDDHDCDFWGLSSAYRNHIHLQSYFLVLKRSVITSDVFYDFFDQVKPEGDYNNVCAMYEDRFTYILSKAGFHFCSYVNYSDNSNHPYRDAMAAIKNKHFPFLKVKFFLGGIRDQSGVADWRQVIEKHTNYPVELIEEDLVRRGFDLASIDRFVQKKRSETPNFYHRSSFLKQILKKIVKIVLKPVIYLADIYLSTHTAQYRYRIDRVSRSDRELRQQYDELRALVDPTYRPKQFQLVNDGQTCDLKLINMDASGIRHFDLELPLTHESNVLLLGNIIPQNLASLELYDPQTTFLNNDWGEELRIKSVRTNNLCGFSFIDETRRPVYFDFILTQPLEPEVSSEEIRQFIANLKRQMIYESVLVMLVADKEAQKYEYALQSEDMHLANSERGLVVRGDPFQTYYDKIGSIKGYKALIYKIK